MKNNGILVIHPYLKSNRMSKDYCLEEAINLIKDSIGNSYRK